MQKNGKLKEAIILDLLELSNKYIERYIAWRLNKRMWLLEKALDLHEVIQILINHQQLKETTAEQWENRLCEFFDKDVIDIYRAMISDGLSPHHAFVILTSGVPE